MSIKAGVALILIALVLGFITFIDVCAIVAVQCAWWDVICLAGAALSGANCNFMWFIMGWIIRLGAIILFIAGLIKLVKSK
jgi:hypothetical protein